MEEYGSRYRIASCSWPNLDAGTRNRLCALLKTDERRAAEFCDLYFDRFYIIHKIGHIIMDTFRDIQETATPATDEYNANLFAIKYFQYKGETAYLATVAEWMRTLLGKYNAAIECNLPQLNARFDLYARDIRTYGALSFVTCADGFMREGDLEEVLGSISNGELDQLNRSIIPRRGLAGLDLARECLSLAFELRGDVPEVEIHYPTPFAVREIERISLECPA